MVFTLASCDKNEVVESKQTSSVEQIKAKSIALSQAHDSLVNKMLAVENRKVRQKVKSTNNPNASLDINEIFDVIQEVTGVRPTVLTSASSSRQSMKSNQAGDENPVINFDVEQLNLSEYASSEISKKYLESVDKIAQDTVLSISEKKSLIIKIQEAAINDPQVSSADLECILNGTEVLNGSLSLWNNEFSNNSTVQSVSGKFNAKPLSSWSFWKKLGFVAAADALGGVLGFFTGGIVTVGGVPVYVPAGPTGIAGGAAALSYIASKMVGW